MRRGSKLVLLLLFHPRYLMSNLQEQPEVLVLTARARSLPSLIGHQSRFFDLS